MSSPYPESSEELRVEVHLFACGHGDTILVGLPGPKWLLIDCYLPKHNGVYDNFLRFLEKKGISRLDWVILTHPDEDHFLGMKDLLAALHPRWSFTRAMAHQRPECQRYPQLGLA